MYSDEQLKQRFGWRHFEIQTIKEQFGSELPAILSHEIEIKSEMDTIARKVQNVDSQISNYHNLTVANNQQIRQLQQDITNENVKNIFYDKKIQELENNIQAQTVYNKIMAEVYSEMINYCKDQSDFVELQAKTIDDSDII